MADTTNTSIPFTRKQIGPELKDLLDVLKKDIFLSLNAHALATVQSFDPEFQTITATINYTKTFVQQDSNGSIKQIQKNYPLLLDVPVIFMRGGNSRLTFPVAKGDTCLVLFNDRDIDNWFQTGQIKQLASARLHSMADGIALIGLSSKGNPLPSVDMDRVRLQKGDAYVGVGKNNSLIKLANATTTLNTLLQQLITDINTLVTQTALITVTCATPGNPSSPPINAAAITAVTTSLSTLASQISGLLE